MVVEYQPLHVPLARGVDLKPHPLALEFPSLALCENALFDEPGSIKKRPGHSVFPLTVSPPAGESLAMYSLTTGQSTTDASSYGSGQGVASITPTGNRLILAAVLSAEADAASTQPTMSGNGVTWVVVASVEFKVESGGEDEDAIRLTLFRGMVASPTAAAPTISFGGNTQVFCAWSICEFSGVDTGGTNGSAAVVQSDTEDVDDTTSIVHNLSAFGSAANVVYQCGACDTADDLQPEFGFTQIHEQNVSDAVQPGSLLSQWKAANETTPAMICGFQVNMGGIAIEIKAASASSAAPVGSIRGLFTRDNELCVCANERIYSWAESTQTWQDRGPYVGCVPSAKSVMNDTSIRFGGDSAVTNGVRVYAWTESGTLGVKFCLVDAVTEAPLSDVFSVVGTSTSAPQCRAIGDFLHIWVKDTDLLKVRIIDTNDIGGSIGDAAVTFVDTNQPNFTYDVVVKSATQEIVVYQRDNGGADQYGIAFSNTAGAASSTTNKTRVSTEGTPIVCAYEPNTDRVAVFMRDADPDINGDILNGTTFADVSVGVEVDGDGPLPSQMTCAFRETPETGGAYMAVVAYNSGNTTLRVNSLTTGGTAGDVLGPTGLTTNWIVSGANVGVGCRAIGRGAHVYFGGLHYNTDFTPDIPGTFFLYRDDGVIVARLLTGFADADNDVHPVPQLQETASDVFSALLTYRPRRGDTFFFGRSLKYVTFDFASNLPYRGMQVGKTVYLPGGLLSQYDSISTVEAGYHISPELNITGTPASGGTALSAGDYFYKAYWEWYNAQGERDLSTFVRVHKTTTLANDEVTFLINSLHDTQKRSTAEKARGDGTGVGGVSLLMVRGEVNLGPPFYQVTDPNPVDSASDNDHPFNAVGVGTFGFTDSLRDSDPTVTPNAGLIGRAPDPIASGEFDPTPAEFASVMAVGQNRMFLAGHENPDLVTYSKIWFPETVVQFNDALQILLPSDGGPVSAIFVTDSGLYIFKRHRIYFVAGIGVDNTGVSGEYSEPRLINADVGCIDQRTLVLTPAGLLFQSAKGFYTLNANQAVEYIGAPVEDYNVDEYVAALLLEDQHVALFVSGNASGRALAFDYLLGQWSTWTNPVGAVGAVLWDGGYVYATSSAVYRSSATKSDAGTSYNLDLETPWFKLAGLNGYGRCKHLEVLGSWVAAHNLRVRVYYDNVYTVAQDETWTPDTSRYEVKVYLNKPKGKTLKVRLTDVSSGAALEDSYKAVALSLMVGLKTGLTKQPSSRST